MYLVSNFALLDCIVLHCIVLYCIIRHSECLKKFYLHDVIAFVQVLRFFREDDWSALLPSTVDFRGTDQIQAVRQPFVVPLESSL